MPKNDIDNLFKGFAALWVLCFVLGLVVTGIIIWALIRVVLHFT